MSSEFFQRYPQMPLPLLETLREHVLTRTEKRRPKWRFRLASDLVIQLQPRPVSVLPSTAIAYGQRQRRLAFEGIAVVGNPISTEDFVKWRQGTTACRLTFEIYAENDDAIWWFHGLGARRRRDTASTLLFESRDRVREGLTPERFSHISAGLMFSSQCLCCGKALTDPASMARFIGPECFGSSSLLVPRIMHAVEEPDTEDEFLLR